MVGTVKEHAMKICHYLYGRHLGAEPCQDQTESRDTCIGYSTDDDDGRPLDTLLARSFGTFSKKSLSPMFSELKNWFRRAAPPGPLKYMRLGPEGRDSNPLMVWSLFFSPLFSSLALPLHSFNSLLGIVYIRL